MANVSVQVTGGKATAAAMKRLEAKVAKKVARQAVNKASSLVAKSAKAKVVVESGTLKRSIGRKPAKAYRRGSVHVAIVGPRPGFEREVNGEKRDPRRYAHLVELGTSHSEPKPFLVPAMVETERQGAAIITAAIAAAVKGAK